MCSVRYMWWAEAMAGYGSLIELPLSGLLSIFFLRRSGFLRKATMGTAIFLSISFGMVSELIRYEMSCPRDLTVWTCPAVCDRSFGAFLIDRVGLSR